MHEILLPAKGKRKEDYLRVIYELKVKKGYIRVKDIAEKLSISPPSVVDFLDKLTKEGLVIYEKGGKIELTRKGQALGKELYERHEALKKFLRILLRMSDEEAEREACYIEHGISTETLDRIVKFIEFIDNCPKSVTATFLRSLYRYFDTNTCSVNTKTL